METAGPTLSLGIQLKGAAPKVRSKPWPQTALDPIAGLKKSIERRPGTIDEVVARFSGAKRELVQRNIDTLVLMGELQEIGGGRLAAPTSTAA